MKKKIEKKDIELAAAHWPFLKFIEYWHFLFHWKGIIDLICTWNCQNYERCTIYMQDQHWIETESYRAVTIRRQLKKIDLFLFPSLGCALEEKLLLLMLFNNQLRWKVHSKNREWKNKNRSRTDTNCNKRN